MPGEVHRVLLVQTGVGHAGRKPAPERMEVYGARFQGVGLKGAELSPLLAHRLLVTLHRPHDAFGPERIAEGLGVTDVVALVLTEALALANGKDRTATRTPRFLPPRNERLPHRALELVFDALVGPGRPARSRARTLPPAPLLEQSPRLVRRLRAPDENLLERERVGVVPARRVQVARPVAAELATEEHHHVELRVEAAFAERDNLVVVEDDGLPVVDRRLFGQPHIERGVVHDGALAPSHREDAAHVGERGIARALGRAGGGHHVEHARDVLGRNPPDLHVADARQDDAVEPRLPIAHRLGLAPRRRPVFLHEAHRDISEAFPRRLARGNPRLEPMLKFLFRQGLIARAEARPLRALAIVAADAGHPRLVLVLA